jgi:ribosomal protein S18 acetylase RimI-like enzyme
MIRAEEIETLLTEIDSEFDPKLSTQVNISKYSAKLLKHADILSLHQGGHLSAFIAIYANDETLSTSWLSMLAVSKKSRKMGLATNLLCSAISYLKNKRFKRFQLEVYRSNYAAIELYRRHGFLMISENEKSIFMELSLIDRSDEAG